MQSLQYQSTAPDCVWETQTHRGHLQTHSWHCMFITSLSLVTTYTIHISSICDCSLFSMIQVCFTYLCIYVHRVQKKGHWSRYHWTQANRVNLPGVAFPCLMTNYTPTSTDAAQIWKHGSPTSDFSLQLLVIHKIFKTTVWIGHAFPLFSSSSAEVKVYVDLCSASSWEPHL